MFISVFDIFKIGVGPSSSHTIGPMVAASRFLEKLFSTDTYPTQLTVTLYGSLAHTGKGHATDRAVILGLAGYTPDSIVSSRIDSIITEIERNKQISLGGNTLFSFDPAKDIIFDHGSPLPGHSNGMRFVAHMEKSQIIEQIYYSTGGGFVVTEDELNSSSDGKLQDLHNSVPYPFHTAQKMLELGAEHGLSIGAMKIKNELAFMDEEEINEKLDNIWRVMSECIEGGLSESTSLPGGLGVKRRASHLFRTLQQERKRKHRPPSFENEWLAAVAMAVNEENAAGGKIVTAPTNGAAGVIPAVINYYLEFHENTSITHVREFLLVAAAIGGIIKHNSSISGAEVGCQGEVGSASAMAAAGLCAVLGGSNEQVENSAEIALEHHLGMTCDPINGLVQIPCIERNGFGAVKAVTAASLALRGDGSHFVSLDDCIKTMYETGLDMKDKYKETSQGGLAVNAVDC